MLLARGFALGLVFLFVCLTQGALAGNTNLANNEISYFELAEAGGVYKRGCSFNDDRCLTDEYPNNAVFIPSFFMLETEVTQDQYFAVTDENPSFFADCPSCPVENVTWQEAKDFCQAIGGDLPTEAMWEYAARAGTTTRFYCGHDSSCLDDVAWYSSNSGSMTHPVAQKFPNNYGLYDMHGNVSEWVNDFYDEFYYDNCPFFNPQGPLLGEYRIMRGGGFFCPCGIAPLRVSYRYSHRLGDIVQWDIGFRCIRHARRPLDNYSFSTE